MTEIKNEIIYLHEKILASPVWVGFLSFLLMAILNISCLDNPPYWDDILGLHNQAVWLAKHNFNIVKLWQPGQEYLAGGSNIYRFGMMPYFYAILYSLLSPKTVHFLGHLFNMGCLALAFGVSYSILLKFKVNNYLSLLWCAATLCEPVIFGRIIALGQECPLICVTVLSIYFLVNKKCWSGLLFVFTAMLCKMTGGILATAFVVWLIICICLAKDKWREKLKKHYLHLIVGILLIVFFLFSTLGWEGEQVTFKDNLLLRLFFVLKYHFLNLLPIQFIALCMVAAVAVWRLISVVKSKSLFDLSEKDKLSLLLIILVSGFWASYGLCALPLPRYSAFIVFPMYIFIALNFSSRKKYLAALPALVLLLAGMLNSNGNFYPRLRRWHLRSGETLERSREYLNDLWENQAACKLLEKKYFERPIVAKWPFLQMLTVPEMGYVTKALPNVYAACPPVKYADVKLYRTNIKMPDNTLYVFSFNTFEVWRQFGPSLSLKRGQKYNVIYENQLKGGWFIIYERGTKK